MRPNSQNTANSEDAASQGSAVTPVGSGDFGKARTRRMQLALSTAIGLTFALLVMGPLVGSGYLMLLDWVPGPDGDLPRTIFGLDGGLSTSILLHLGNALLGSIVGSQIASWLPFLIFFPLAFVAMAQLAPGGYTSATLAGALYALNPFVVDRFWAGHIAVLLGYALLPFFVRSVVIASKAEGLARLRPALWIAVLTGITPHYIWICGLLFAVALLFGRHRLRDIGWAAFSLVVIVATSLYILSSSGAESRGFAVGQADLDAYDTRASLPGGIYTSVALLHGFWRLDRFFPTMPDTMTFVIFAFIATLMAIGFARLLRTDRHLLAVTGLAAVAGYLLALGAAGPTGWLFGFAFDNIPGFAIMREPQKFVAVIALFYALCFGAGVAAIVERVRAQLTKSFLVTISITLPLLIGANALFAFHGELEPTEYPVAYQGAEAAMGNGDGALLWLPWHQYASQTFTNGRIVAEPAGAYFEREVISGDNVELPEIVTSSQSPRSAYIEGLLERGQRISSFGQLVAPLGVEYVALAKTNDFDQYRWLNRQTDLDVVLDTPELILLRNQKFQEVGYPVESVRAFENLDQLIATSNREDLSRVAFGNKEAPESTAAGGIVTRRSNTGFTVDPAVDSRTGNRFVIGETFDTGWADTQQQPLLSGTLLTDQLSERTDISYSPWRNLQLLYALSVATFVLVWVAANRATLRRKGALRGPLTADSK